MKNTHHAWRSLLRVLRCVSPISRPKTPRAAKYTPFAFSPAAINLFPHSDRLADYVLVVGHGDYLEPIDADKLNPASQQQLLRESEAERMGIAPIMTPEQKRKFRDVPLADMLFRSQVIDRCVYVLH